MLALVQVQVGEYLQLVPLVLDLQWVLAEALVQELDWVSGLGLDLDSELESGQVQVSVQELLAVV